MNEKGDSFWFVGMCHNKDLGDEKQQIPQIQHKHKEVNDFAKNLPIPGFSLPDPYLGYQRKK